MANKTKSEILSQVYEYVPQVNQTSKTTLIGNLLDYVAEDISKRHDFRCLRATTPDTCAMTASQYSVALTAFTTMGSASTPFKDILHLVWMKTGTNDYGIIKFIEDKEFHTKVGYYDYSGATLGKPSRYTRLGDTFLFNCPADESITLRAFYQKFHGPFGGTGSSHEFSAKDNMLAFMALVYGVLKEAKESLTGLEFPQEMQTVEQKYEMFVQKLIASDKDIANEDMDLLGWGEKADSVEPYYNPYGWV